MSGSFTEPEFLLELMGAKDAADTNAREVVAMLARHPDLPTEVALYIVGSAETLVHMAAVMGRLGETLMTATEIVERKDR